MAVKVQFQIGHTSKLRSKKTVEGFTHDWELYVKGVQQADISTFVEKIIFNLHESFQKPKRVCSKPPYSIQESGYAGFLVFIDIYFRNRDEPKKVQFSYDLDLQQTGPPQHRHEIKTFIFDNPSEEYRQKLLKSGGVPVSGVVAGSQPTINNNSNNMVAMPGAISLNHSQGEGPKTIMGEPKKHKLRPDDTRSNSFANVFGTPITKTSALVPTSVTKHSPDNKLVTTTAHATHQSSSSGNMPALKEKSSKDKEKSLEKSKERSEKREKHHKQSLTSPHKEGRSDSKKSEGSKHEKRDKNEEKSKKDKNRDRERDRDKSSGTNINSSSANKRPTSPKPAREHSPHKSIVTAVLPNNSAVNNTNTLTRPASSNSGKLEEVKPSAKSSKDSSGEAKSKESKQKESSSSSSSGKKSKKEKKDKDKERDKEKRHEEREKQKLAENQQRSSAKEDNNKISNNINTHSNNANSLENKNSKSTVNTLNPNLSNDVGKKNEKLPKQDLFKSNGDKAAIINAVLPPPMATGSTHSASDKKSSSSSSLNSNSNPAEKDKRSHKHKKKEKNKDKDKDKDKERDRDKERDKDKDKEKEKDKDNKDKDKDKEKEKDKDGKKEKEVKEKHTEEKVIEAPPLNQQSTNAAKVQNTPALNAAEELSISPNTTASNSLITTNAASYTTSAIPSSSSSSSSTKSSKNKDKKSKDKSSNKEDKLKHKTNDMDTNEPKAKQAKLTSSNSINTTSSSATSTSSSSVSTSIVNSTTNPSISTQSAFTTIPNNTAEANMKINSSDIDSFPATTTQQVPPLPNESTTKPSQQPSPIITHSDSSNSSFPDLPLPKQQPPSKPTTSHERAKSFTAPTPVAPTHITNATPKDPHKSVKPTAKEKSSDKASKEDEKEKKKRRNSQAVNTFIEPPVKQLKTKDQPKPLREKSKSPSLRNTGSRASISADTSTTFLQPSASPSSTAAAAPLPPPSSAPSAAHSPALSATEAVGNATSATANAATCNSNSTPSSTTNSAIMAAPHHLPLEYLSELQELHHKIMTLQDNEDLQHVVELIAATGCYEITTKTFDFDLCKLDRGTVQRLQEFFATSVS